jgi:putative ABC transport system permease protein
MKLLYWALRELRNNRKFTVFFVINLSVGMMGFISLQAFKSSVAQSVEARSKTYLGADLGVSARRDLEDYEKKILDEVVKKEGLQVSAMKELYSMTSSSTKSRLVNLRVVDRFYPFYGEIELRNGGVKKPGEIEEFHQTKQVWVYPEILIQLNAKIGDELRIGKSSFKITDVIEKDSGNTLTGGVLAPRMYVSHKYFDETGLISKGSTAWFSYLLKVPDTLDSLELKDRLSELITAAGVRVYTHKDSANRTSRIIQYLNDYLGLASLVALFLAAVGAAYIFRNYLSEKIKDIAIYVSLGLESKQARRLYLLQLGLLGFLAAIPALLLSAGLLPLLKQISFDLLPFALDLKLDMQIVLVALALGVLGSIFICLPLMDRLKDLNVNSLFQESYQPQFRFRLSSILWFTPFVLLYYMLSVWQSQSIKIGSLFFILFSLSGLMSFGFGYLLLFVLSKTPVKKFAPSFALKWMVRSPVSSLTCFVAIALGVLLLSFVQIIETGLSKEVDRPMGLKLPNLFLFDIQEEQVNPLNRLLKDKSASLAQASPLVRARIMKVNGEAFEKSMKESQVTTREEERARRSRNRGYNLSYRLNFTESEKLVRGELFKSSYDPSGGLLPGISVEIDFARRLGWDIGDKLTFDIQGVEIEGEIKNFRSVNWASFQPNFFIQFQPGVLDEAPKSFVASIGDLNSDQVTQIQSSIVDDFPNISIIDVSNVIKRILEIAQTISWALKFMAILCLLAGLTVLYSIARNQISLRGADLNLLKVLGCDFSRIYQIQRIEFLIIASLSSFIGVFTSLIISYGLSVALFNGIFYVPWAFIVSILVAVPLLSVLVGHLATRRILARSPSLSLNRDQL